MTKNVSCIVIRVTLLMLYSRPPRHPGSRIIRTLIPVLPNHIREVLEYQRTLPSNSCDTAYHVANDSNHSVRQYIHYTLNRILTFLVHSRFQETVLYDSPSSISHRLPIILFTIGVLLIPSYLYENAALLYCVDYCHNIEL